MMSFKVEINDLSKYRAQLMGVATLMIIACHAAASYVVMPVILKRILDYGNYGVDIFLLLSGLGCFYSINKLKINNIHSWGGWLKKRLLRILIPYWIIYIPYCLILIILGEYSVSDCLFCLSTLEFWLFHRGAWFVSMIIVLYLLSPLLYFVMDSRVKWPVVLTLVVLTMLLCNLPVKNESSTNILSNMQFAYGRMPCFLLGMALGNDCMEKKTVPVWWFLLVAVVAVTCQKLFGMISGFTWATTPLMVFMLILIVKALHQIAFVDKLLKFLGRISLESYLTNITIKALLLILIPAYFYSPIFYGRYLQYAIVIIAGLLIAYRVNCFYNRMQGE